MMSSTTAADPDLRKEGDLVSSEVHQDNSFLDQVRIDIFAEDDREDGNDKGQSLEGSIFINLVCA